MRSQIRLLNLTVAVTSTLLLLSALLVVLGVFNEHLQWDIFGPQLEAVLYGVFMSSLGLAAFGIALTVVLGIREIVQAFRVLQRERGVAERPDASRGMYLLAIAGLVILPVLLVLGLNALNTRVTAERSATFKRMAKEQIGPFAPRFREALASSAPVHDGQITSDFYDLVSTVHQIEFVDGVTVFALDPHNPLALLRYDHGSADYSPDKHRWTRLFLARSSDKDIRQALEGNEAPLRALCEKLPFVYCHVVPREGDRLPCVLRIQGSTSTSYRE